MCIILLIPCIFYALGSSDRGPEAEGRGSGDAQRPNKTSLSHQHGHYGWDLGKVSTPWQTDRVSVLCCADPEGYIWGGEAKL